VEAETCLRCSDLGTELLSIGDKKQKIAHDSKRVPHTLGELNDHNETMRDTHFQIYIIGASSLRQV